MHHSEIHLRDPFVLPLPERQEYWLFGTTDQNPWSGPGTGFDCYRSHDLVQWEGPIPTFRPSAGFWATTQFWAPEVHFWRGHYYMFATFKASGRYRGTQILVSGVPEGPYAPLTDGPITPPGCECLDGTLHVDDAGRPWLVYCHEWTQIHNGAVCALPLSEDFARAAGRQELLFHASEASWVQQLAWPGEDAHQKFPVYVTDGPFLHRSRSGHLSMLWSSASKNGYAMGVARSVGGTIHGPWVQEPEPLWDEDGGHGMIFQTFDGRIMLSLHLPNQSPHERPVFLALDDTGSHVRLAE